MELGAGTAARVGGQSASESGYLVQEHLVRVGRRSRSPDELRRG